MKRTIARILALIFALGGLGAPALADVSASTRIYDSSSAYLHNVDLAIAMLDGAEVWADDVFSFNDTVGPRTREEGYQVAENGRGSRTVGGGVAQVATTLYLALKKRGGADYIEKQVYGSKFTGGYVNSGSDAIVTDYQNGVDFSFLNTGGGFTIEIYRSGNTVHCSLVDDDDWDDDYEGDWDDWDDWDDGWDDYIFHDSDYVKLTKSQIRAIPREMWGYARNEIYARHGYQFKTKKYRDYFMSKDWYEPGGFSVGDLNATEWYNMELIKSMEQGTDTSGSSSGGSYIFPHSSTRKLTRREILAIPKSQWGYARNEIYARHGYVFKTKKYRDYFNAKSWYAPGGFDTTDLNATEWYNMELIKSLEDDYGVG